MKSTETIRRPWPSLIALSSLALLQAEMLEAIDFFGTGAEVHASQSTAQSQWTPRVARLTDGRILAVWDDNSSIKGRLFHADTTPAGDEFEIDEAPFASTNNFTPDVAALPAGGFIVTWQGYIDTTSVFDVFARAFDGDAEPIAATFRVNDVTVGAQNRPSVEVFDAGKILFVWQHDSGHPTRWDVKYRIFHSNLTPVDTEQHLATALLANQFRPDLARLGDGSMVAVWDTEESDGEATRWNVRARRIGSLGALGDAILVNTDHVGDQYQPSVAPLGDDGFVVAWTHDPVFGDPENERGEIRFQRFHFDSTTDVITLAGSEAQANTTTLGTQWESSVVGWNNGFAIAWTSENNHRQAGDADIATGEDGSGAGVYARGYDADGTAQGLPFRINLTTLNHQYQPKMAALNGFSAIIWTSKGQDGDSDGVYLRRIQTDAGMVPADPDPNGNLPTSPPIVPTAPKAPPSMTLTAPASPVFAIKANGRMPRAKICRVGNSGGTSLTWRVAKKPRWLKAAPASGVVAAGQSQATRLRLIKAKLRDRGDRIRGMLTFDALGEGTGDRTLRVTVRRTRR